MGNKRRFERIIGINFRLKDIEKIDKTLEIIRDNSMFKKITRTELIRQATLNFCENLLSANDTIKNKIPENAKNLATQIYQNGKTI